MPSRSTHSGTERMVIAAFLAACMAPSASAQCEVTKLRPETRQFSVFFGNAVSIHGNRVIIGDHRDFEQFDKAGAAYVFRMDGSVWIEEAKLTSDTPHRDAFFGSSVSAGNGVVVVGAALDDRRGPESGAAYVFRHNGSEWVLETALLAADTIHGDQFGNSVALDGGVLAVGAPRQDPRGTSSGAAYVFRHNGIAWIQEAKLVPQDGAPASDFGGSIDIEQDRIAVGAWRDDNGNGENAGAVYVFERIGGRWIESAKIITSDGADEDVFGRSVAVSGDRILAGADLDDDAGSRSGSAYVFRRKANQWTEEAKLVASDALPNAYFGVSVDLLDDVAIVGAFMDGGVGSAYLFRRDGAHWNESAKLRASDAGALSDFGLATAIDGELVAVGARGDRTAYVFFVGENGPDADNDGVPDICDNCPDPNPQQIERSDLNCDGRVDAFDVEPFIDVLLNHVKTCAPCVGDVNEDGTINAMDIEPFIQHLLE